MGSDQSAIKIAVSNAVRSRLPLVFVNALILILNSQQREPRLIVVSDMETGGWWNQSTSSLVIKVPAIKQPFKRKGQYGI